MTYSHFLWSTIYQIFLSMFLLYSVIGIAAIWGLLVMVGFLIFGAFISKKFEEFQSRLLSNKDDRMVIINEILNGIKLIKLFAWENKFLQKLYKSRQVEVNTLKLLLFTNALSVVIWDTAPTIVACIAFLVHIFVYKHELTPPVGFAALTLFNLLRFPLGVFPEMINNLISASVSFNRIETFLNTPDIKGLIFTDNDNSDIILSMNNVILGWNPVIKENEIIVEKKKSNMLIELKNRFNKLFFGRNKNKQYKTLSNDDEVDTESETTTEIDSNSEHNTYNKLWIDSNENNETKNGLEMLNIENKQNFNKIDNIQSNVSIILSNINFTIYKNTLNVIIGPTGSGM